MKKTEKSFDSVRLMRSLRDALSEQMQGMTCEEQMNFIKERLGACPASAVQNEPSIRGGQGLLDRSTR